MTGYMYYADGSPRMELDRLYGRVVGRFQAEVRLERPMQPGDTVLVHMGHGRFKSHVCVDSDEHVALLVEQ